MVIRCKKLFNESGTNYMKLMKRSIMTIFLKQTIKTSAPLCALGVSVVSFIFLTAGCEKRTDWALHNERTNLVIVDGGITNEKKEHIVRLTFPVSNLNEVPQPVSGATVIISDNNNFFHLTEKPAGSGIYKTDSIKGEAGKEYTLLINDNGSVYTAKAEMLAGNGFSVFQYSKNKENLCRISHIAAAYNATDFAIWEINLDWTHVPGYDDKDSNECRARILYYTLPTIDVSQVLAPAIEKTVFPVGTVFTERRYSITREHAEFIRALLSETTWQGGFFDSAHSGLPTNMSAGAAGFFAASGVTYTPMPDTIR